MSVRFGGIMSATSEGDLMPEKTFHPQTLMKN
jgi:hypothetical protein